MLYCAEMLTYTWLMLLVGCLLSLVGDMGIGGMVGGLALGAALPFALYKDLNTKVQRRDQDILMELPETLNRVYCWLAQGDRATCHRSLCDKPGGTGSSVVQRTQKDGGRLE